MIKQRDEQAQAGKPRVTWSGNQQNVTVQRVLTAEPGSLAAVAMQANKPILQANVAWKQR